MISAIMDAPRDIFNSDVSIPGASSIYTDGEWIWRSDLQYYFSRYHVILPIEFMNRISEFGYEVPSVPDDQLDSISDEMQEKIYNL
ncbi:hypothetical protein [Nocardia sp. NPDC058666]|uniref:hypothetical protein n=1 Tax=Nocardia sp. NPDC058666 TaxID=3346587 RepID=UPI003649267F